MRKPFQSPRVGLIIRAHKSSVAASRLRSSQSFNSDSETRRALTVDMDSFPDTLSPIVFVKPVGMRCNVVSTVHSTISVRFGNTSDTCSNVQGPIHSNRRHAPFPDCPKLPSNPTGREVAAERLPATAQDGLSVECGVLSAEC